MRAVVQRERGQRERGREREGETKRGKEEERKRGREEERERGEKGVIGREACLQNQLFIWKLKRDPLVPKEALNV